jgi:hypothetical protein
MSMFSLHDRPARLCDGLSRRELLRVGGLSALGLSLPGLLQAAQPRPVHKVHGATFGRAKNVIFLWLQGGPPQHETFDPKPEAPAEVRGEFKPIATNVPGVRFCELLPRTARIADKLAVVRSLCTHSDLHDASGYWVLTGYRYTGRQSRQISPTDWPYLGSVVKMLKPSKKLPSFSSVWLPDVMRLNDNVQPAGQTAGFLGKRWEPERFIGDPSSPHYRVEGLALPGDVPPLRLSGRQDLLRQVQGHLDRLEKDPALRHFDRKQQEAFSVLTSGRARQAFDLGREPPRVRERFGPGRWGPCLLLARRLVEAGARLVHVNWPREDGDSAVDNPMWDTHAQNADRLQDVLCPQFDVGFPALIQDLDERGLLAETLVVAIGEFGRTPKINANGGRDHWGHVFSFVLAGAGISGGQVYGASDKLGAHPKDGRLEPQDLSATILHLLGIGHEAFFPHPTGRPLRATEGTPIYAVLGEAPATDRRTVPGGDPAFVPVYNTAPLLNPSFEDAVPLQAAGSRRHLKGWQAVPLAADFGVNLVRGSAGAHVVMGLALAGPLKQVKLGQGSRALLAQEVRNPRAGRYTLSVHACGGGRSPEYFRDVFLKHFACRLVIYGFADAAKDPRKVREFASAPFQPRFEAGDRPVYEKFSLSTVLKSQDDGAYHLSRGVGVAVVVEKITPGELQLGADGGPHQAFLCVDDVALEFTARPRNDDVQV